MGKDLQEIKPLAEQMYRLAAVLLRLVDMDEQARQKFIEDIKKTRTEKLFTFPARWRRNRTTKQLCKIRQSD